MTPAVSGVQEPRWPTCECKRLVCLSFFWLINASFKNYFVDHIVQHSEPGTLHITPAEGAVGSVYNPRDQLQILASAFGQGHWLENPLTCFDGWETAEYPEETHASTWRTCKDHIERNPGHSCCEATMHLHLGHLADVFV